MRHGDQMATTTRDERSTHFQVALARLVMIVMAIGIAYTGYTLLTTAWAIPFVVVLWLGAAAILNLGLWAELPHDA
jgi:cytochrome b subunit of formate dehydrogenase